MEKGDVAWAGGSAGPDFFIMMNRNAGFGASHTVWGSMADDESMELALKLVQGKSNSRDDADARAGDQLLPRGRWRRRARRNYVERASAELV